MGVKQVAPHTPTAIPTAGGRQEKTECLEATHLEFRKLPACGFVGRVGPRPGREHIDPAESLRCGVNDATGQGVRGC